MEELLNSILDKMSSVKKPHKKAIAIILMTLAHFQGRANFRNLSRFCTLCEDTLGRWARRSFPYQELNSELLMHNQDIDEERVGSIDASYIPKSGKATEGLGYFYSGCESKVKRGLEMSLISVIDMKANTGFGLLARQTQVQIDGEAPTWNRIDQALSQLNECKDALDKLGVRDLVADAWYSKCKFVNGVVDAGFRAIGKLRQDAHLKYLYTGKQKPKGRRRRFDGRVTKTDFRRFKKIEMHDEDFDLYEKAVYSPSMKRVIKVVALRSRGASKKVIALLFSTHLEHTAIDVLRKYRARFQIEFVIRDAKQHVGLTHSQARSSAAIENHLNQSISALNLLKIEDQKQVSTKQPKVISIASWRRRKFNQHFAEIIFSMLDSSLKPEKIREVIDKVKNYGCIAA